MISKIETAISTHRGAGDAARCRAASARATNVVPARGVSYGVEAKRFGGRAGTRIAWSGTWKSHRMRALRCAPTLAIVLALPFARVRSEEHTSELQSLRHLVCRLLLEKKKTY